MLITAPQVVTANGSGEVLAPGYVEISDGLVTAVGRGEPARRHLTLDAGLLVPGFIDLQVNGYFGVDLAAGDAEAWACVVRRLPETGTTAFLPTFITAPLAELAASLDRASRLLPGLPAGARVLGVHVEGPFLAPSRRGAHNPEWIVDPSAVAASDLIEAGSGVLRLMTLAPERPGAAGCIRTLASAGVLVSVGHSDATAEQTAHAAGLGARMVTHLYNAQSPLRHRSPGVVGQALTDPRLTSGLIADLHHVSAQACLIAFRAAPGRVCLVTDAAACAGMQPGRYELGGEPVELPGVDGEPPVRDDGTIAGSALRMDTAVANSVASGIKLTDAVEAATRVPADLVGRPDLGRLAVGAIGDVVWLGPALRTRAAWVSGHLAYADPAYANAVA